MGKIVIIFLSWIILVFSIVYASVSSLDYHPTFPYANELMSTYGNRILTTFGQFDGVHYLTIATKGYEGTGLIQAFFPLYPLLIKWLSLGIFNKLWVGIGISLLSLFGALYFLKKLLLLDENETVVNKSLWLVLLFPTSFFLGSVYTESLFLLLVVTSFYAARKEKWWLAGLLGILATATRLVGIFLVPALIVEYLIQNKKLSKEALWCLVPILGMISYIIYLGKYFHDPLLFYHVQSKFGANRSSDKIILLYQVFYRYIKMIFSVSWKNPIFIIVIQEFIAGLFGLIGLGLSWFRVRRSYVVFGIGAYLLPTLTGTFSSMPRYLLPIFPLYLIVAKLAPRKLYLMILALSTGLLIYNVIRFTQGLWVA